MNIAKALKAPQILRAFRPGDVVFLELTKPLPAEQMQHLSNEINKRLPEVKLVLLQAGVRVAARSEEPADADLDRYRELERRVREFLDYVRTAHETNQIDGRLELGHLLHVQKALEDLKP